MTRISLLFGLVVLLAMRNAFAESVTFRERHEWGPWGPSPIQLTVKWLWPIKIITGDGYSQVVEIEELEMGIRSDGVIVWRKKEVAGDGR